MTSRGLTFFTLLPETRSCRQVRAGEAAKRLHGRMNTMKYTNLQMGCLVSLILIAALPCCGQFAFLTIQPSGVFPECAGPDWPVGNFQVSNLQLTAQTIKAGTAYFFTFPGPVTGIPTVSGISPLPVMTFSDNNLIATFNSTTQVPAGGTIL